MSFCYSYGGVKINNINNLYLFDIDGTLANIDRRRPLVTGLKKDWPEFNRLMSEDLKNDPVFRIFENMFVDKSSEHSIGIPILVSGRSSEFRDETIKWFDRRLPGISINNGPRINRCLYMRQCGDFRPDEIVKKEILDQIRVDYPDKKIMGVFDDRPKVIKMWRENGLFVFDCSNGASDF